MSLLASLLTDLPEPDEGARAAVAERAASVLRPTGALARLDEVAAWLAAWQRTERPAVDAPHAVVFAADHGVAAAAGVSAYPTEVTVAMLDALEKGAATAAAMTKTLGMTLDVVDVGVARPTGDLRFEPAMDEARFDEAVQAGVDAVARAAAADLLVFGEMGIGNTTAAAAVAATLYDEPAAEWCGRGTGLDDDGVARKDRSGRGVPRPGRARSRADPIEILRHAGARSSRRSPARSPRLATDRSPCCSTATSCRPRSRRWRSRGRVRSTTCSRHIGAPSRGTVGCWSAWASSVDRARPAARGGHAARSSPCRS